MDTWEVVLILILLTISLSVIANREVPLSLINLLDNTYFQMVVLIATLVVATISPPVAIVSISTIVTIYYIRNVVKVQIMKMQRKAEIEREEAIEREAELLRREGENNEEPRIEIHETTSTITTTSKDIIVDKEALEEALKEHETRQGPDKTQTPDSSNNLSDQNVPNPDIVDMIDPRKSGVPTGVEAFDLKANNNSAAPLGEKIRPALGAVDSPVFTGALETPASYNEMKAPKKMRAYRDNKGQYDLNEERPLYEVERYETADYMPGKDMGSNDFELLGTSIDDKINILTKGVMPSSEPPPEFDQPLPAKSR